MVAFRGQKKKRLGHATPRFVSFRGLIQNFRRVSPSLSYGSPLQERINYIFFSVLNLDWWSPVR